MNNDYTLNDMAEIVKAWLLETHNIQAEIDYDDSYPVKASDLTVKITPISRYTQAVSRGSIIVHWLFTITVYQSGKSNLGRVANLVQGIERSASVFVDDNRGIMFSLQEKKDVVPSSIDAMAQGNLSLGYLTLDIRGWRGV